MNFGKTLSQKSQQFLQNKKSEKNLLPWSFSGEISGFSFDIEFEDFDKYSFVINDFRIKAVKTENWKTDDLQDHAQALIDKLTYFLEDLQIVEIDPIGSQAQLRSKLSNNKDEARSYFEVILQVDRSISLKRYRYAPETKERQAISYLLSGEVFERCVNDVVEVLSNS